MSALSFLAALIQDRAGIVIGPDKEYLLDARLAGILRRERLSTLAELASQISTERTPALEQDVIEAVTTAETLFFRDRAPFEHLRTVALPRLLQSRPPGTKLRLWSAATASGQEAYSIAMTLLDCEIRGAELVCTDLARHSLERAMQGLYTQYEVQRGLPIGRLLQYFTQEGTEWRVTPELRAPCFFRQWNLLHDPAPLGRFDVVFCRNVLFYFDREVRAKVLAMIRRQMAPDGLLYLGATETLAGLDDTLERDGPAYVRKAAAEGPAPRP